MSEVLSTQAAAALNKGKFKEALSLYKKIISVEPHSALGYEGASVSLANLEDYHDAMAMAVKALEIDPKSIRARITLAYVYDELGEREKSRNEANSALNINPESAEALACVGTFSFIDSKIDEAIELLEKAVRIDPHLYSAQNNLALAYQKKDRKKYFSQSIAIFRLSPTLKNLFRVIYLTTRFYRYIYILALFFSVIPSIFLGAEVILLISSLLAVLYFVTGIFVAFANKKRQWNEMRVNLLIGLGFVLIGVPLYMLIKIVTIMVKSAAGTI